MTLAGPAVPRPGDLEAPGIGARADPSAVVYEMISGYWHTQLLWVAARLGVHDRLADGPASVGPLARATGTHAPSLARVLRALVAVGVCDHRPDDTYALTELGWALTTDAPGGGRDRALLTGGLFYTLWAGLLDSVRTGETAAETILGMPVFDYFVAHPDLGFVRTVLDAHPACRGVVHDLPDVVDRARETLAHAGLTERCTAIGGDFFVDVPTGGDVYVLSYVLHDWDDARATAIHLPPAAERWRRTPVSSSSNRRCPRGRRRATR